MNTKKYISDYLVMFLGSLLMSAGVYFFKIPNGFSTGGVSGAATLLGSISVISPATWITIFNIALLIIGFITLGKGVGIRTVFCTILFSAATQILEWLIPMTSPLTDQPLLELIYAMLLTSVGSALIFYRNGSSGGTDIIALIIKKHFGINVGTALLCVDCLIAASAFMVFDVRTGLFSVLGLLIKAFLVDGLIQSFDTCKCFMIVTSKPDEINEYIMQNMHHSSTIVEGHGAYSHSKKWVIYTVCRPLEAIKLQKTAKEIDPDSFITITTSNEIIGKGFKGSL